MIQLFYCNWRVRSQEILVCLLFLRNLLGNYSFDQINLNLNETAF